MKGNLAVRSRAQAVSRLSELALDRFITIKLTIDHDSDLAVFAGYGLVAGCEVNDAEARVSQGDAAILLHPMAVPIRPAMVARTRGPAQRCFRVWRPPRKKPDNTAHGLFSFYSMCTRGNHFSPRQKRLNPQH